MLQPLDREDSFTVKYQKMKKYFLVLAVATTLIAGITFTSYRSSNKRQEAARTKLLYAKVEMNSAGKDANSAAQQAKNNDEWMAFKSETEHRIRANEIRISEFNINIRKQAEIIYALNKKKVANLEQQIIYLKARLINYEKGPTNWASFKRGFNYELDAIEKALKDLMIDNEK